MKKLMSIVLLSCTSVAFADCKTCSTCEPSASTKNFKFGVVSMVEAGNAEQAKELNGAIQGIQNRYGSEIMKIEQELQKLSAELNNATQAKLKAKMDEVQEKIIQKQQEHDNKAKEAERATQREAQRLIGNLQENLQKAIEKVAEKKDLDVVFQKEALAYVKKGTSSDITKDVLAEWDSSYKSNKSKAVNMPAAPENVPSHAAPVKK